METATLGPWRQDVSQFRTMQLEGRVSEDLSDVTTDDAFGLDLGNEWAGDDFEEEVSDSSSSASSAERVGTRLKRKFNDMTPKVNPELKSWVRARMGTRTRVFLVVSFVTLEAGRNVLAERAYSDGINLFSIIVVTNFASLIFAVWLSLIMEGGGFIAKVSRWYNTMRFFGISFLFTFASILVLVAYRIGTPPIEVVTVGYIYMPISAALSYYVFRRKYGTLEWLSVGMMSLAVLAFVLLREESKGIVDGSSQFVGPGLGLVLSAVVISVAASILAERAFKEQAFCGSLRRESREETKFYIMKVHLDFASLVISVGLWVARRVVPHSFEDFFVQWSRSKDWFGNWGTDQFKMVFIGVAQSWAAGLVTKEFSTVIKAIVQTLSVVLVMCIEDKFMGNRFHFASREVPSILLAVVLLMSAIIFQTGRINLQVLRKAANITAEAHPALGMTALAEPEGGPRPSTKPPAWKPLSQEAAAGMTKEDVKKDSPKGRKLALQSWQALCTTYALILVYIVSDAGRTIILQKTLQSTVINSTSMGLVCYICGCVAASGLSLYSHGFKEGLARAWNLHKILRCLPAAFLFALATALGNMAFAQGINSALYVVLGKFYTPVAAIGARWIMGKYYMWLEWFALLILTLASIVFGYLQAFDVASGDVSGAAPVPAMLLVLIAAATSALASLVTEKILKEETVPFHMQKVRLDAGSILSSLVLLPALGFIATRSQDIPWASRPYDAHSCPWDSVCWDLGKGGCGNAACDCECTSGVFAGWTAQNIGMLSLAVFINTAQGWLVGKVTQQFSVIHRAIADSFSLLAIYFIGDPIFNHTSLSNWALNLVAFIVPVSTATFSVATSEMQNVFNAREQLRGRRRSKSHSSGEGAGSPGSPGSEAESIISDAESVLSLEASGMDPRYSQGSGTFGEGSVQSSMGPASPNTLSPPTSPSVVLAATPGYHRTAQEGHWM